MSRLSVLFMALACAVLALGIAACSDDAGTTTDDDTGSPDTGAGDTGGGDMLADQGGGDMLADQGDDAPVLPEVCEPGDCTAPQACVGGACIDPVDDEDAYTDEAGDRDSSYFWSIQLPAVYPVPERCCFDYNGDPAGNPDDGLGALLGLVANIPGAGDFDIQGTLDASLVDGTITLVTDWTEFPEGDAGDVKFSVFLATNDLDDNGEPDDAFWDENGDCVADTRCGGDGDYELEPLSFGDYGSQVQFNVGVLEGGVVFAGPSTFTLTLDIEILGGEPITLNLLDAQVRAPISVEANGIHTVDEIRNEGTEDEFFAAGGQLGGVIDAEEILTLLDDQFRGCGCAGINPDEPVITYEIDQEAEALVVSCTDNTGDAENDCDGEGEDDGPLCAQVGTVCGFASFIGNVLDVDRDNDGINESLSAGLRFAWSGAAITGLAEAAAE